MPLYSYKLGRFKCVAALEIVSVYVLVVDPTIMFSNISLCMYAAILC